MKDETNYKVLLEKIKSIQENLDLHIRDTDKEIGDIQNLRMEVASLRDTVNELRRSMDRHADKVTNRFAQVIEPVITSADNLKESIEKKKFVKVAEKKRHWWKFW